jgi:hypothetical protein
LQAKESVAGVKWLKVRQIAAELYGGDLAKAQAVALRREAQGKYRVDLDFPDDKEERRCPEPPLAMGLLASSAAGPPVGRFAWCTGRPPCSCLRDLGASACRVCPAGQDVGSESRQA